MGMLPAPVAAKLGKLIGRLGSDHDGEIIATGRAIQRTLKSAGCDLHDLAEALTAPPPRPVVVYRDRPPAPPAPDFSYRSWKPNWRDDSDPRAQWRLIISRCRLAPHRLSRWETTFLDSLKGRLDQGYVLTQRQRDRLFEIEAKLKGRS